MTSLLQKRPATWLLTSAVCLAAMPAFAADQVIRRSDGDLVRGKLETLSRTRIEIRRTNDELVTISPDDIRDIRFDREPPPLQSARSNERSGEYSTAIEQLREVQNDYEGDDLRVTTEIEFLIARCLTRQAMTDPTVTQEAIDLLRTFLQQHANSYRSLEATLLQARLLAATDLSRATRLLEELKACGVEGFELQAGVILGQALLREDKADQALAAFDEVKQKSREKPGARAAYFDSLIGHAACLQKLNRLEEALQTLDAVVIELPEQEEGALARAWNQIGDCQRDSSNPRAALLAYLHVDILYAGAANAHAEALFRLAPLWEDAGHPERARDARSRLQARYPRSQWAQKEDN